MKRTALRYPGLAILADLYLDRFVFGGLIVAALAAGTYLYS